MGLLQALRRLELRAPFDPCIVRLSADRPASRQATSIAPTLLARHRTRRWEQVAVNAQWRWGYDPRSPGTQEQVAEFQMDRGRVTVFLKAATSTSRAAECQSSLTKEDEFVAAMSPST